MHPCGGALRGPAPLTVVLSRVLLDADCRRGAVLPPHDGHGLALVAAAVRWPHARDHQRRFFPETYTHESGGQFSGAESLRVYDPYLGSATEGAALPRCRFSTGTSLAFTFGESRH